MIAKVIKVCAYVVLSEAQAREAHPHLRRAGFRLPQANPVFERLEGLGKLKRLRSSAMQRLDTRELKPFRRGSVRDDVHLYEAAMVAGELVVTEDKGLLDAAEEIRRTTGVSTVRPDDA